MNNISLRNKILIVLSLPILVILILSGLMIKNKIKQMNSIERTKSYLEFSINSSELMLALQKEKESSLKFVSSYGKEAKSSLLSSRENLDENRGMFNTYIKSLELSNYSSKFQDSLKNLEQEIKKVNEIREKIDEISISNKELNTYYNNQIEILIDFMDDVLMYSNNGTLSKKLQAYVSMAHLTSDAYEEKRVLSEVFETGVLSNKDYAEFSSLVSSQNTFLSMYKKVATKEQLELLKKQSQCDDCKEVVKFRQIIFDKSLKDQLVNQMLEFAGYGGLIHNFKNYVIRYDDKYMNKIQKSHSSLKRVVNKYRRLKGVTKEEKKLLKSVKNTFDDYLGSVLDINEAINSGKDVKEIDSIIDINDSKAIRSLKQLSKNIFGADVQKWQAVSSKRIDFFIQVEHDIAKQVKKYIDDKNSAIIQELVLLLSFTLAVFIIVLIISTVMTKKIVDALKTFKQGLEEFFLYVIREKEHLNPMEVKGSDEFAQMTHDMNTQIKKIEQIIEQDKKVVNEISDVMGKVSNGFFEYRIHEVGATQEVESLKEIINKMITYTKQKVDNINKVLDNYAMGRYNYRLNDDEKIGMYGDFGTLSTGSVLLGQSISQLVAMITNAGRELESNTVTLTESSRVLSASANEQASSLEETAASIEEITNNMKSSSNDVVKMLNIADELNSSALSGNELATKTSISMEEINEKVAAISEAISVIDQIAFQTNILSLNAAVEAATAGEAGKGFAVVAQEVRNLAGRSAQAASQIKKLVEDARSKSNEGKEIATNMIDGYTLLSNKITDTKDIIDNVSCAIKEQEAGMIQINDAITLLDSMTQKNASTSASIDTMSKEVASLSIRLLGITAKTSINDKYYSMVDDIDLIQEISRYKNEHINFKKNYFKGLDSFETCTVTNCKSCNLGAWINSMENERRVFTQTKEWNILKEHHTAVHEKVQDYMDYNANKADNKTLKNAAANIEDATTLVFESLNEIAVVNSKLLA